MVGGKSDENLGAGCRGRILRTRPVAGTVPGVSNCAPLTTYFEILHLSAGRRFLTGCVQKTASIPRNFRGEGRGGSGDLE